MADDPTELKRLPNGRFPKGYVPTVRRRKGSRNKIPKSIKEALIDAGSNIGADGKGKHELTGFFERVGRKDPVALGGMLARGMTLEVKQEVNDVSGLLPVNIITVPLIERVIKSTTEPDSPE